MSYKQTGGKGLGLPKDFFKISYTKLLQKISILVIYCSTFQHLLIAQKQNNSNYTVIPLKILPPAFEYLDELLILVMLVIVFIKILKVHIISRKHFYIALIVFSFLVYTLLMGLVTHTNPILSILYFRGEAQGLLFAVLLLFGTGVQYDEKFRYKIFKNLKLIFWINIIFMCVESLVLFVKKQTFFLRDFGVGALGGSHHADFGFFMTIFCFYYLYVAFCTKFSFKNNLIIVTSIIAIGNCEFKTGMLFLPIAVYLLSNYSQVAKLGAFVLMLGVAYFFIAFVNRFTLEGMIISQTLATHGTGRWFIIYWIFTTFLTHNLFFGLGPSHGLSSTGQYVHSDLMQLTENFTISGGLPQSVILIGETGILSILILGIMFFKCYQLTDINKKLRLLLLFFYITLSLFAFSMLELQIINVLFWSFFIFLTYEKKLYV